MCSRQCSGLRGSFSSEPLSAIVSASSGLLLYTDGLAEARRDGEFFGLDRVNATLVELTDATPRQAVDTLRARVAEFADGALTDDLRLLAARVG